MAVYDVDDGRWCDEDAPVVPPGRGSRFDRLLQAEAATLAPGGIVVRLGGLYIGEEVHTDHPSKRELPPSHRVAESNGRIGHYLAGNFRRNGPNWVHGLEHKSLYAKREAWKAK